MAKASPTSHADLVLETHQSRRCGLPPGTKPGQVVLLTAQVEAYYNGLYRVNQGQWHHALDWKRRDRVDGDPIWQALLGPFLLIITVPHAAWFWEWSIDTEDEGDVARGTLYVEHEDADEDAWDYQDVGLAQARAEAVAYALVAMETK